MKEKEALEVAIPKIEGSELISDVRAKVLHIPAPDPGNIVGYEYEVEERPMLLQDIWTIQRGIPVLESHYSLQIPAGWEYKPVWLNASEVKAVQSGANQWQWAIMGQQPYGPKKTCRHFWALRGKCSCRFLLPVMSRRTA